ncbi:MAG: thiol peroxidase [Microthrixaceae bacterium]
MSLGDLAGRNVVLNVFPSVDTPTCAASVRTFNERAASLDNTTVLCVSADLPFAQQRFCGAEGIENVQMGSTFRNPDFGRSYGLTMTDGPMAGLLARAVVVVNGEGQVVHSQLVPELADEPDYDEALAAFG